MRGDGSGRCEKKNGEGGGGGRGESEGKPAVPFFKEELVPAYQNIPDSGIPYDWSILTALVSTRRFITLTGNAMR